MKPIRSLVALCALALPLFAHDFWIEPSSHQPEPGKILGVTLKVGDYGVGDAAQRADARIVDFSVHGPGTDKAIVGRDGADPAGWVRLESAGTYVLGYRSHQATVELEAPKFEDYLREKGLEHVLEHVLELRRERGESSRPVKELYSRCAKAIVRAGDGPSTGFDRMLGYPLEISPEKNPTALAWVARDGASELEPVPVRIFFRGQPLANALVGALDLDLPKAADGTHQEPITVRTDEQGRATLALPHGGRWLFAVVHMVAAEAGSGADWESFWASLTFEAPAAPSAPAKG